MRAHCMPSQRATQANISMPPMLRQDTSAGVCTSQPDAAKNMLAIEWSLGAKYREPTSSLFLPREGTVLHSREQRPCGLSAFRPYRPRSGKAASPHPWLPSREAVRCTDKPARGPWLGTTRTGQQGDRRLAHDTGALEIEQPARASGDRPKACSRKGSGHPSACPIV
jgi:hypothetical protein